MTKPDSPSVERREHFTPEDEEQADQEAWKLSRGDIALWFHHRSLLTGEFLICQRGEQLWGSYLRTKLLAQYAAVEQSVIEAWRIYVQNTMGIPPEKQADPYAANCGIVLDALKRKRGTKDVADVFRRRSETFHAAAKQADSEFFRAVGRLLSETGESPYLKRFEYAHSILWRWLTEAYWLMPAKLVSELVAMGLGVTDKEKTFLAVKCRYGLKSHEPSLIDHFEKAGLNILRPVLTKKGKLLLG